MNIGRRGGETLRRVRVGAARLYSAHACGGSERDAARSQMRQRGSVSAGGRSAV